MVLEDSDRRSVRKAAFWIFGTISCFLGLFLLTRGSANRSPVDLALIAACQERYASAHSRGDSILVDAWIPRPDLQGVRNLQRCEGLVPLHH